jgi:NADPH:quinone reductase-like Zn-dependent oxidoreductase
MKNHNTTSQRSTMKAVVQKRAGSPDRLVLAEIPRPDPAPAEVLVRVHATSVTRGDVVMRKMPRLVARLFGETPKSIPGNEFAGQIEAIGEQVTGFRVGDRVFGTTNGLVQGSYAEYIALPEGAIFTHIPPDVAYEEAAPIPVGAMTALHFLQAGQVASGKRILINGASGSVGGYAVQVAKHLGAHVTGVASSAHLELVTSLGADEVIDYTQQDFIEGGQTYDVIFDAAGKTTRKKAARVLERQGRFVTTRTRRRENIEELHTVRDMVARGAVKAVIDRSYTLDQMSEAHRQVEEGRKRGNVVVVVSDL